MELFCRSKTQYIWFYITRHLLFGMTPTEIHMHSISMCFSKTSEICSLGAVSAITIWLGLLNAILRTAEPCSRTMDFQLNIHLKYVTSLEYSESMNIAELESYNNIPGITTRMASDGINIYYCKRLHHINL